MNIPNFMNRWLIVGTLETRSELHIGSGSVCRQRVEKIDDDEVEVSSVMTDRCGRAYVPGSGLKGALRSLVFPHAGPIPNLWERLFGSPNPDDKNAVGGILEFWDAFHVGGKGRADEHRVSAALYEEPDRKRPWWDDARKTCVAVGVSLDRRTKTARENLLYYLEYVPAGERFRVEISGENLLDEEVENLLGLLACLDAPAHNFSLGAMASNGWGRVAWKLEEVRCLGREQLELWKKKPVVGLQAVRTYGVNRTGQMPVTIPNGSRRELVFDVRIVLEAPWLIRDPRQRERSQAARKEGVPEGQKPTDAIFIQDECGKPFAPAKSIRGALRAQAEKILRTLGGTCAAHPAEIDSVSTKGKKPEDALSAIKRLDLVARLFGLGGWRGPLEVSRFVCDKDPGAHPQEFVAVDRFTGGAADKLKFDAILAKPSHGSDTQLTGTIRVDLYRLRKVDEHLASLGLLALALRDLAEGDIAIGCGSAKGQGACTAQITLNGADWRQCEPLRAGLRELRNPSAPSAQE